jgi:hypothetical protein
MLEAAQRMPVIIEGGYECITWNPFVIFTTVNESSMD